MSRAEKKFDSTGETIVERWSNVDDLVLISGATRLGLLNPKAGKSLEMINWMRNHASPAHDSNTRVEKEDVISLVLLLQKICLNSLCLNLDILLLHYLIR